MSGQIMAALRAPRTLRSPDRCTRVRLYALAADYVYMYARYICRFSLRFDAFNYCTSLESNQTQGVSYASAYFSRTMSVISYLHFDCSKSTRAFWIRLVHIQIRVLNLLIRFFTLLSNSQKPPVLRWGLLSEEFIIDRFYV